jgi:phospholipid transport system substrate-binding protein
MSCKNCISIAFSLYLVFHAVPGWPAPDQDAEAVINTATVDIYRAIQDQCEEIQKTPLHLHKLVEEILIPHADFNRMAQLALGKNWRTEDTGLRSEFVLQFRQLLVRTYATAVQMASLEAIHYLPARSGVKPDTMVVRTEVRRPGEALVTINYNLYKREGQWLVYDILVDGISLVSNYRTTFAEQVRAIGLSGLVDTLEKKNQQPLKEANADLIRKRAARACKQAGSK